ncbi:MAG: rod shape-determining protein RodA [Candidatus Eremiobacteraeota bacterium]|nr:rod shape-determining protein RodA [Candidatus Eremiobacteraeota bacterium]
MNRAWWHKIDFTLVLAVSTLVFIGILMIYSANGREPDSLSEVKKQLFYFLTGLVLMAVFTLVDYELWGRTSWYIYGLTIALLIAVMLFGHSAKGAQRWLSLGPIGAFQPSEMAKLAVIITLARFLSLHDSWTSRDILKALFYMLVPLALIFVQPDLGTALVLLAVTAAMLFAIGVKPWILLSTLCAGLFTAPFILKEYQKKRLLTFLNPEADPEGAGWNLVQAKIAVGSGKLWGKGIFMGTQNNLNFVPEHSTDFIFTVIGEELGLVGGVGILVLYFYVLWKGIAIAESSHDLFGSLLAIGIVAMLGFHVFVNIGMTLGIMPVAGIPLPFVSYGGSSLITSMVAMGMLGSIYFRRERIF